MNLIIVMEINQTTQCKTQVIYNEQKVRFTKMVMQAVVNIGII